MRRRRARNIIIELTSLLDVIMIMIFMVMNNNSKLVVAAQDELGVVQLENIELADKNSELSEELAKALELLDEKGLADIYERLENAENQLDAYQALNDEFIVINVKLENSSNNTNTKIRTLSYSNAADPNSGDRKPISSDSDLKKACNTLTVFIADMINDVKDDSAIICVVFSYDPDNVYQVDFAAVDKVLKDAESNT